ncbi:hypothetical protein E1B28_010960 [Marasmius oreades]|uniref:C2H2-type domain-containing protein n=1 Tax=Marasmius oreades TaxID=181124 RepID=A0A9P7RT99_9AGAR|nr:uncharacterized protein E1B28_010960 [Marasmius oreades]KAG7089262.1 hypothetical protein E1B28_010960 [Marasmius oreades]
MIRPQRRLRIFTPYPLPLTRDGSPHPLLTSNVHTSGEASTFAHQTCYFCDSSSYSPTTPSTIGPVTPSPVSLHRSIGPPKNWAPAHDLYTHDEVPTDASHQCSANYVFTSGCRGPHNDLHDPAASTYNVDLHAPTFSPTEVTTGDTYLPMPQSPMAGWELITQSHINYSQFHDTHYHTYDTLPLPPPDNAVILPDANPFLESGSNSGWEFSGSTTACASSYGVLNAQLNQSVHLPYAQGFPPPANSSTEEQASNLGSIHEVPSDSIGRPFDSMPPSSASPSGGEALPTPIVCPTVAKPTVRKASRDRRKKEAKHSCHICFDTFTEKHGLRNHLNVHYGRKPYACDGCKKRFTTSHTRNRHVTTCSSQRFKNDEITFVNLMQGMACSGVSS